MRLRLQPLPVGETGEGGVEMRVWAAGLRASWARFALRRARPSRASSGHF
jgi:hypothetical protein